MYRPTKIDTIPAESFPNHYFHFTSYNQLPTKLWDPRDKGIKNYPILTDYIGCYITSGEAGNVGNPTTNQSRKLRKVEIQNLNRISIELTLWDDLVDKFEKQEIERLERPIIIAVTSCKVTKFLKREKNRVPFQQLFKHKAASYKGVRFTCQATITRLNTSRGWYYTSCCVCINKVTHEDGNYKCKIHGVIPAPNYRYNFKATLTDGTGSATFIFFTPKADDFIGVNCGDLVASNQDLQRGHFPNEIEAIVGTDHTFQFHYNTTSNPGITEFVMDEVFGITDKPKQIASDTSGKQLELLLCITRTISIAYDNYTLTFHDAGQKGTPHCFKNKKKHQANKNNTQYHKQKQNKVMHSHFYLAKTSSNFLYLISIFHAETTPPQAASVAMQTRSKTEMEPNVAPKTVKHRIFTEEPSENKKKELECTRHPPSFAT
ncbi:nucleic acid-binding, OB-fold protein [Artemisia annua]|uniref:Nucleic acid-binding, OB-fold protein n=1 Tax=Artemisia annua TaxID=35608 RepID=A0A2U1LQG2_ARTAN|nr:nucleic acid-binding, OB-fold protein [Artemisia annua]